MAEGASLQCDLLWARPQSVIPGERSLNNFGAEAEAAEAETEATVLDATYDPALLQNGHRCAADSHLSASALRLPPFSSIDQPVEADEGRQMRRRRQLPHDISLPHTPPRPVTPPYTPPRTYSDQAERLLEHKLTRVRELGGADESSGGGDAEGAECTQLSMSKSEQLLEHYHRKAVHRLRSSPKSADSDMSCVSGRGSHPPSPLPSPCTPHKHTHTAGHQLLPQHRRKIEKHALAHTDTRTHAHTYTHKHTHSHTHTHAHTQTRTHTYTRTHTHTHTHTSCINTYTHAHIRSCTQVHTE